MAKRKGRAASKRDGEMRVSASVDDSCWQHWSVGMTRSRPDATSSPSRKMLVRRAPSHSRRKVCVWPMRVTSPIRQCRLPTSAMPRR